MKHWNEYWVNTKYKPLYQNPPAEVYGGTNFEPLASIGMSCFTDAIRTQFKEGITVIDYGCGAGILANFISERLENFNYFGLEPSTGWGPNRINLGRHYFNDPRVTFGYTDIDFKSIIETHKVDSIILISVFTHLIIEDIYKILDELREVFIYNTDASIVFSCFTSEMSTVSQLLPEINSNYYRDSYINLSDLQYYCSQNNLKLEKHMDFTAMGGWVHEIFKITKL